jgi:hypothetical protein
LLGEPTIDQVLQKETQQMRNMKAIILVFVIALAVQANAQSSSVKDLFAGNARSVTPLMVRQVQLWAAS